jgi:hypothetical protein
MVAFRPEADQQVLYYLQKKHICSNFNCSIYLVDIHSIFNKMNLGIKAANYEGLKL